jgi:cell division protease FtsH
VARKVLMDHREHLDSLAQALLERETLDSEEIQAVIDGRPLPERTKVIIPSYSEKEMVQKEKRRATSIFGAPKPATG